MTNQHHTQQPQGLEKAILAESSSNPVAKSASGIKIAIVGDVHNQWDADDEIALNHLKVDLVLLVGDFGNEAVEVVKQIAALPLPKAVVLGNHDAWYTATPWGVKHCPYDRRIEDRVQQQLDLLGDVHVGYRKLDFPGLGLTVVGGRPFSWGGSDWKNPEFFSSRFGVNSFEESTARMVESARNAAFETVIFLGHCGPLGLGDAPEDPCGRDWQPLGGDHGDPDLAAAIAQTYSLGKTVPLVAFGHMHHQLRHTKQRLRTAIVADPKGTIYVNAARVPRIVQQGDLCLRNYTLVTLQAGIVSQVSLAWVDQNFALHSEESLYSRSNQTFSFGQTQEAVVG
jgi:uncharacterized protein (TIGR04168 family)